MAETSRNGSESTVAISMSSEDPLAEKIRDDSDIAPEPGQTGDFETVNSVSASSALSLVRWSDGLDPANPKNFTCAVKCLVGVVIGLMNFIVSFAISIFSGVEEKAKETAFKGEANDVMQLGVSLYILGLAIGM